MPASVGVPSKPTLFGSQVYAQDDIERALALISGCGGTLVRVALNGNLDYPDAVFAAAARKNMRVILLSQALAQPVNVEAFAADCAKIQQRYAQYDPIWEIWNEPNLAFYWGAQPNVDDYSRLAIKTGKALRAAGARDIWSGGISGVNLWWIYHMKLRGVFDVMNGCAVHSYKIPCTAYTEYAQSLSLVPPGVPIHTTETCVPSSSKDQADFLRQMWYIHRSLGLPTMIWCELRDGTAGTMGAYTFPYGLVYPDYTLKPAYYAAESLILPPPA
ncbi:MAG: hypothetical protein ACXVAS_13875 [Vulcanimicrobiaceae bacterium]